MTQSYFAHLVNDISDRLYRYIVKQGVDAHSAEDIMQNCFEALWKSQLSNDEECRKYLFGAAYNQCAGYWRKAKGASNHVALQQRHDVVVRAEQPLQAALHKALLQLSSQQRSLVLLKDYEGFSYEEIATLTQLNQSQVKVYLHRARKELQQYLGSLQQVI